MAVQNPVHFDIVGSFLRPERLKKAREAFRSGALGQAGLRRVEDEEIRKLISKEKGWPAHPDGWGVSPRILAP